MLICICGTPSRILNGVIRILETVTHLSFDSVEAVGVNTTDDLRKAWRQLDDRSALIVYCNNLQPDLSQLLIGARVPVLLCIDDFSYLIKKSMVDGFNVMEGSQLATAWHAQLADIVVSDSVFITKHEDYTVPVEVLAKNFMDYLQIKYTEESWTGIKNHLNGDESVSLSFEDYMKREFPHFFDPRIKSIPYKFDDVSVDSIINDLARPYATFADGKPLEGVYWHRLFFRYGDVPDKFLHGSVALVGPARMLFFGPYLHLPPGQWVAEVQFEVNDCGSDTIAMADAYDDAILNAVSMRFPRRGTYSFTIEFEILDPRKPVQIRLQMLKGAIEGEFLLHGVEVRRQSLAN